MEQVILAPFLLCYIISSMSKQKPMDPVKKANLLICGEMLLIAIVFLVLGILRITSVIKSSEIRAHIFNIITTLGSTWVIIDFFWSTFSRKRHEKVTYLDKCLNFPMAIGILAFDIYCLIHWTDFANQEFLDSVFRIGISVIFLVIAINYIFQSVFHYFRPTKALLAAVAYDEEQKRLALEEVSKKNEEEPKK